jgi:protein-S-isoprenylcysteine O-methyltransferase Ste14
MALREELERQGAWLFRRRSYLPLLILPVLLVALRDSECLEPLLGDGAEDLWEFFCIGVSFFGFFIRCFTVGHVPKGTSGRNTKDQIAERLNTTGMYSVVRHPLYLGNFFIMLGMAMFTQVWWFVLIAVLAFWIYYERIIFKEEEFLRQKFGDAFVEWARTTPAFLPRLGNWRKPDLPFSLKTVLKREYTGLFVISSSFTLLETAGDFVSEGALEIEMGWLVFFGISLVAYLTLRTLKKKTRLLHVEGR